MKKTVMFAAVLAMAALVSTPLFAFTWTDNFESGLGAWSIASGCAALSVSTAANTTPGGSRSAHIDNNTFGKEYHNLGQNLTGNWSYSFNLLDDGNYNAYGEIRGYTGTGTYAGNTLVQDIIAGSMGYSGAGLNGELYNSARYQGRFILATGSSGWFNLNATRSAGWHTFTITRTNGVETWYVDGVADRSFTNVTDSGMGVVVIGAAANGPNNAFFDDVKVTNVLTPEPASLLTMGAGLIGLAGIIRRKRA